MKHRSAAVLLVATGLLVLPTSAQAHVILTRFEVPAGTSIDLELRAPIEREGVTNRKLQVLVPSTFTIESCRGPNAAWTCSRDSDARDDGTLITWETPVAGSPQDLRFFFRTTTPASKDAGTYLLPAVQTYSDGTVVRWINEDEPEPAPRLTVVPAGQPVSNAAPSPPADSQPAAAAPASAPAVTAARPSAAPVREVSAPPRVAGAADRPASPAAVDGASAPNARSAAPAPDRDLANGAPAGGDGGLGPVLGVGLLLGAGGTTAAVLVRRRRLRRAAQLA